MCHTLWVFSVLAPSSCTVEWVNGKPLSFGSHKSQVRYQIYKCSGIRVLSLKGLVVAVSLIIGLLVGTCLTGPWERYFVVKLICFSSEKHNPVRNTILSGENLPPHVYNDASLCLGRTTIRNLLFGMFCHFEKGTTTNAMQLRFPPSRVH